MNSKGRSSAAWWAEPQPVETGLSVDDRPNELNIAFWVISSVGAASPLLLHIIYVSVRAPSLFFSLSLSLSFISRPPTQTHHYLFLLHSVLHTVFFSFSLSLSISSLPSIFFHPPSLLPALLSPGISLILSHSFSAFSHSFSPCLCISLLPLSLSPSPLLFSLSLPPFVSFPPSLSSSLFFFSVWHSEPFFSQAIFPFEPLFHSPPSHFLSLFPSLSFLSHAYEVA